MCGQLGVPYPHSVRARASDLSESRVPGIPWPQVWQRSPAPAARPLWRAIVCLFVCGAARHPQGMLVPVMVDRVVHDFGQTSRRERERESPVSCLVGANLKVSRTLRRPFWILGCTTSAEIKPFVRGLDIDPSCTIKAWISCKIDPPGLGWRFRSCMACLGTWTPLCLVSAGGEPGLAGEVGTGFAVVPQLWR
jgi:hypothetical protein